ncbi:MAG: GTP pyrophosphokinase, partial [Clostridia bacterium]|nr:GTP pyrophosphokinase [Clostridia bacterium]
MQNYALPYRELMSYYRCAMMEVETKFNVLNEELSLQYDRNPIETIKTRLKSPESILE